MTPFDSSQYDPTTVDGAGNPLHPVAAKIHQASLGQGSIPPPNPIGPSTGGFTPHPVTAPVAAAPVGNQPPALNNPSLTSNQQQMAANKPPVYGAPEYKTGRLHNILGLIGAGLVGASNPAEGVRLAQDVPNTKYNAAVKEYQSKMAPLEREEGIEKENRAEGTRQVAAKGAADYRTSEIEQHRKNAEIAQQRADTAEELAKQRSDEIKAHTQTIADLNKKNEDIARIHEAMMGEKDPAKLAALQQQYETLVPPKPVQKTQWNDPDTAAKILHAKNLETASPSGQAAAAATAGSRIAAGGTPQALEVDKNRAAASTTGRLSAETNPDMIEKQADLAHAKSIATVTQQTKNSAEKAQVALQAMPDIRKQVNAASDTLFANRWKEFRTGKLGTEDSAQYAALRANVDMLQDITALLHSQRGSSKILTKFENLFNVDKMNKKTFLDSVGEVEKWLKVYAKMPNAQGNIDLEDVDKIVNSNASGKYGVIQVK